MFSFLRKMLGRQPKTMKAGAQPHGQPTMSDLEPLILDRFLKPRRLDKAAPGWPDDLTFPVVEALIERGEISTAPLEKQLATVCRVVDLKGMLKERGLPVSGTKPVLARRLIDDGYNSGADQLPVVYECTDTGCARAVDWRQRRESALANAVSQIIALLRTAKVGEAIELAADARRAWPTLQDIATRYNPMALHGEMQGQSRLIEIILSGQPGILANLAPDDLGRLQQAVAIWQLGIPNPGIQSAMADYVGVDRFDASRAQMLLLQYARNLWEVERMRGGLIKEATVTFINPCVECAKLDGQKYSVEELPELPNPGCVADGCIFLVSPDFEDFDV